MNIKNIFKLSLFSLLIFTVGCDDDDFYTNEGTYEVTNISSVLADGSTFYYDNAADKSVTIMTDNNTEGAVGSAVVRKRINTGEWFDHATISVPSTLELSLDDVLSGTGIGLGDISTGDFVEIAYFIDGTFLNGNTVVPIECSTDVSISNQVGEALPATVGETASISFDLGTEGPVAIESIGVLVAYNGGSPIALKTITEIPSNVTITLGEVSNAIGVAVADIGDTDYVDFSFSLNSAVVTCPSSQVINAPLGCISALEGTYEYTTTSLWCGNDDVSGEVTWTNVSPGVYEISDWSYGSYLSCYGGEASSWGALQLSDVCDVISIIGTDVYGDTWSFSDVTVDGANLTLSWSNTYNESGVTTLTRTDGSDWPPLSR